MKRLLLSSFLFFHILILFGQEFSIIDGKAIRYFREGEELVRLKNYEKALEKFQEAIDREGSFVEAYAKKAQVYLRMGKLKKAEAIAELGKARLKGANVKEHHRANYLWIYAHLLLEKGDFEAALVQFQEVDPILSVAFKQLPGYLEARERIDFLEHQLGNVMDIEKERLPLPVNMFKLQYFPVLTADGRSLFFTKRDGTGSYDKEDIFVSYLQDDSSWTTPESIDELINSSYNEGTCTVTADGSILIYTSCDAPDSFGSCDLYIAYKVNGQWQRPKNMGKSINSRFWDSQPSLSADGRFLFFSSNRRGGHGGNDIWYAVRQGDGSWSEAKNLGAAINTPKDEISPFMFFNNEILFFASNGHLGFGGMDIFMSRVEEGEFSIPENLGLPINDQLDQVALFITAQKDYAYYTELISDQSLQDRAFIYRFLFPQDIFLGNDLTVTGGRVLDAKTGEPLDASLSLVSLQNDSTLYQFQADGKTGAFMMLYPPTNLAGLYVEKGGYLPKIYNVQRDSLQNVKDMEISLTPISSGEGFIFENVFFDFDKVDLKQESKSSLQRLMNFLTQNPSVGILITGHTDTIGSVTYNQNLSLNRAKSVRNFLIQSGISEDRVQVEGKGASDPLVPNTSPENQALNRRITVQIR